MTQTRTELDSSQLENFTLPQVHATPSIFGVKLHKKLSFVVGFGDFSQRYLKKGFEFNINITNKVQIAK